MSYNIEIKMCSKAGYHTPQEAKAYYGRYSREGVTVHWWGDGTGASNHDNIVNYFLSQASLGNKSVNYVVSDNKITLMVSPDNVAWTSQSGNPTTISIEHQPTLGAEGYKKSGWLVSELEKRYGRILSIYPHSKWFSTSCPGTIDLNRIRAEANKWKAGGYSPPKPIPVVTPTPTVTITYTPMPIPVKYVVTKDTDLWNFNTATWAGFKSVKKLLKGEQYIVAAIADNHNVHAQYGVTGYSYTKKITNGVNMKDLSLIVETVNPSTPSPLPPSVPVPPPVTPTNPVSPGVPVPPPTDSENLNWLVRAVKAILAFFKINL